MFPMHTHCIKYNSSTAKRNTIAGQPNNPIKKRDAQMQYLVFVSSSSDWLWLVAESPTVRTDSEQCNKIV